MASTDVLSQTLSSITAVKLDQFQKQKEAYEQKKRRLDEDVASEVDTVKRVRKLLKGCERLQSFGLQTNAGISGLGGFLDQAEYDPSVSEPLLKEYEAEIQNHIRAQTSKYEFASLYGKLVEEWIASGASESATASATGDSGFVAVGREEMHQQRATWEGYVFQAKETDGTAIKAYLDDVFSSRQAKQALGRLREGMATFQKDWQSRCHFGVQDVEEVIKGMLRSDILTEEKRTTLREFLGNKVVMAEIADVLNMRMSTLASWTWGRPLIVEQRRNLNGRYRFYTDEDLLQAMFVYCVGMNWAVQLRQLLVTFVNTEGVWQSDTKPISQLDARRRRFFLNDRTAHRLISVQENRDAHFRGVLVDQLPASFHEVRGSYGDAGDGEGDTRASHMQVVQELLRRLQSEILMQTRLGKEITVIRSDFKWFGPSLPHSTIFAVLEYLGVHAEWRDFFRRVLEAEMRFKQDSPDAQVQIRKRGTTVSTALADFLSESVLFCLDYAVNQKASGMRLYRLHDDMWLWGDSRACGTAWGVVCKFTAIMGLELNAEKTGSVRIAGDKSAAAGTDRAATLPAGDVKWGFLKLDPVTGRFLIDQDEVDKHIEELRLQLSACRSILDYVQAWNIYGSRFFANHFGTPANCYGRAHIDSMLATFRRIQERLFPNQPGGVGTHLKLTIAARFGIAPSDIPDGYLYWPASMGGLGLQNPFVALLLSRRHCVDDPGRLMDEYLEAEELAYERAKARFCGEGFPGRPDWRDAAEFDDLRGEPFMSLAEFARYRERTERLLGETYARLMERPALADVVPSSEVTAALPGEGAWDGLGKYEQWVVQLYHKDLLARFGGLGVVDQGLLPMGLIAMLGQSRFQWHG